jgi:nucleotide-binding universal stress UspA family protein
VVIIAGVDRSGGTDAVVTEGMHLAEAFDEELHVVHAMTQSEFIDLERTSVENDGNAIDMDRIREMSSAIAADRVEAADVDDSRVRVIGLVGDPASELLRYAREVDARYVVVGGRKRSPVGKAVFGSVTQEVILNADRPVVTVMDV